MKQVHSTKWKGSTQPRKQRKYLHNLPDHLVSTQLHVHLNKPLREKHGIRAIRVRAGDKVKVVRGTHKGKEGKANASNHEASTSWPKEQIPFEDSVS